MNRLELFKRNIIFLFVLFLITCSSGDKATEPEPVPPSASFTLAPSSGYAPLEVNLLLLQLEISLHMHGTLIMIYPLNLHPQILLYVYTARNLFVRLTVSGPGGSNFIIQKCG